MSFLILSISSFSFFLMKLVNWWSILLMFSPYQDFNLLKVLLFLKFSISLVSDNYWGWVMGTWGFSRSLCLHLYMLKILHNKNKRNYIYTWYKIKEYIRTYDGKNHSTNLPHPCTFSPTSCESFIFLFLLLLTSIIKHKI